MFRNEVVTSEMTHRKIGLTSLMIPVSFSCLTTSLRPPAGSETEDYRCKFQGKLNTLRTLSSEHGIELGFFSRVRNDINPHIEPAFLKVIL